MSEKITKVPLAHSGPTGAAEMAKENETAAAKRVRANTTDAVNYDLTDPANPKIKGADGDWHDAK